MKRLYLLRHAKSSWDQPQLADHERPLAPRGRRAAELLARHLRRERIAPARVLCSSARRSRATLEAIAPALDQTPPAEIERGLYRASDGELLERLNAVPDSVESVLLIGHNPAVQQLALNLADSGAARARVEASTQRAQWPCSPSAAAGVSSGRVAPSSSASSDRRRSALLVAAADSPPEFHEPIEALARALPNARTALVGGGHLIDPAAPEAIAFIKEELESQ